MGRRSWVTFFLLAATLQAACTSLASSTFIHPQTDDGALIYGVEGGIVVGVHPYALDDRPDGGPRGLLRIGYEEDGAYYLINYIAVEPVAGGRRGFSELEVGRDGKQGKGFLVRGAVQDSPGDTDRDVPGRVWESDDGPALTFVVHVESFENGARPVLEVTLFEQWPERARFRTFSGPGGRAMDQCILTATMGNRSRCRYLWLGPEAVYAPELYADYHGDEFTERRGYDEGELHRTGAGDAVVVVSPDEFEPGEVLPFANRAWHHPGRWTAQFWLKPAGSFDSSLRCRVNGRKVYWGTQSPIPGGISFENFELQETFLPGSEIWFGYTSLNPREAFGFSYDVTPGAEEEREIPAEEAALIESAARTGREPTNGDFWSGLDGWEIEGGASGFGTFPLGAEMALTTFGSRRDANTGRLSQCFEIPSDASELRFFLHGGCDRDRLYTALWRGGHLWRKMTARNDNTPFEIRWDVEPLRGEVVTLEICDESEAMWGFIGAHGFRLVRHDEP